MVARSVGALYPDERRRGSLRDVKSTRNKMKCRAGAGLLPSVS